MLWSFLHISAKLPNQLTNTSIVSLSGRWDISEGLDENPSLCSGCRNAESCGRLFSFMACFGLIVRVTLSKTYSELGLVLFCVSTRRDSSLPLEVSPHSLEGFPFFPIMVPLRWLFLLLFLLSRDSVLCALLGFCIIALPFITFVSFTSSKSSPSVCGMDFLRNRMDQLETISLCDVERCGRPLEIFESSTLTVVHGALCVQHVYAIHSMQMYLLVINVWFLSYNSYYQSMWLTEMMDISTNRHCSGWSVAVLIPKHLCWCPVTCQWQVRK